MERERFNPLGLIGRIVLPFILVYGTWNPSGQSFYHWAIAPFLSGAPAIGPVKVLVALLLLAGWFVVIQATRRSLGLGGAILIAGIFRALVWLLIAKGGVFQPHSANAFSHLGLVALESAARHRDELGYRAPEADRSGRYGSMPSRANTIAQELRPYTSMGRNAHIGLKR